MPLPTLIHVDSPTQQSLAGRFAVYGWVASEAPLLAARIVAPGGPMPLAWEARPDVRSVHSAYAHSCGFRGAAGPGDLRDGVLVIECETAAGCVRAEKVLPPLAVPADKAARLERIRPHLRADLPFRETPFHFDFLTDEVRRYFNVADTDAVSGFEYAPDVRAEIDRVGDGLVLDCGAGNRPSTMPNVVNLEIVPYASTDVVSVAERLPFRDNTFALVVSCAVLEHLKDPFAAAREIIRVTRPGGLIYADVPFLQPFHGYPSHYYNMTMEGLKNLFAAECSIERAFVPRYGSPVWTLTWFLNSYAAGLPEETRRRFLDMRVSDLMAPAAAYLDETWVSQLTEARQVELACANSVVARKR